jgi:SAM-dependent methyltransferase
VRLISKLYQKYRRTPAPSPAAPVELDLGVALRDSMTRGWLNAETGELFTNFPVGPQDIVADIGCGDGGNARFCASRGARLILADIDEGIVARAAARVAAEPHCAGVEVHVTDSDPLPIASNIASKVVCTEVIEHVEDPARLMAELFRIGRPGARYLIACPDPASEMIQKRVADPSYFERPNHIRIIQHAELDRYVEAAGLIIEGRYSHGFYGSMWWALFWAANVPLDKPDHPLLESWAQTWRLLLDQPNGAAVKHALDDLRPMSQVVIARKP